MLFIDTKVGEAWLPPFHLGEQKALEMGGLPFPEWRRHVC